MDMKADLLCKSHETIGESVMSIQKLCQLLLNLGYEASIIFLERLIECDVADVFSKDFIKTTLSY